MCHRRTQERDVATDQNESVPAKWSLRNSIDHPEPKRDPKGDSSETTSTLVLCVRCGRQCSGLPLSVQQPTTFCTWAKG